MGMMGTVLVRTGQKYDFPMFPDVSLPDQNLEVVMSIMFYRTNDSLSVSKT